MKYHLFKKLAALGMAASVSLSAITPAFAADDSSENSVIEAETSDGGSSDDETPEEDEVPPANEDNSNKDETPSADEDNSNKDEVPPANDDNSNEDETPSVDEDNSNKDEVPPANEDNSNDGEQTPSTDEDNPNEDETTPADGDNSNDEVTPPNEDTSNEGEQTPPSNEDNSNKEETPPTSEDNSNKQEETPNNTLEEEKTPETPTVKPDGYGEVTQAGGKGDSFVTLEIVNDGSSKPNPNPNPGGGGEDPDNPGGGGGGEDPDPVIFSAYVPSKLPMKLTEDGTVLTPNNAAIINGVATKGIVVKDIEAHLDYDWAPEDWDADYPDMPVNTKMVGLKLRGDTLSKDGDFSVNAEDWKIPKDSYIDLNMEAKLPPQEIETPTQNSDVAVLSFTLDWSGDDTTTGPKWNGGAISPDTPTTTPSKPKAESNDTIVAGGSGDIHITWDSKDNTVTLDSVTSSNTDVASIGNTTGSNGNKTATVNGLKSGTSTITATLSNGETVTYGVIVYEVGNPDDIKVSVSDKKFNVGDSITSNDVTASVPLIAPDGSTKTMTVKPSVDKNTLQAGSNSLTGTVTVGNQEYPIHFDVAVENPDDNKSGITAESTDTLVEGETGEVTFTWDTKSDTITLTSVTSSNQNVATVGTTTGSEGNKTTVLNAIKGGTSTITATLSNGETATFEATVYEMGNPDDIQTTVNNKDLSAGDKVTPNDVTVKVPIISPDGNMEYIEVIPSIEDKALTSGNNSLTGTITVGGNTYNITIIIEIAKPENPSNDLVMSVQEAQAMGFTFASYQDGLEITGFENKMFKSTINVPEQIGDFKVIRIGNNAFEGQSNLKEITLPPSITEIGNNSFEGCTSLTTFDSNAKLHKIGARAFLNCTKLSSITLNTASDFSMEIVRDALYFSSYKGRKSCDLTISPFIGCNSLEEVTIDGDITSLPPLFTVMIEKNVFDGKDINLPLYNYLNSTDKYYNGQYTIDQFDSDIIVKCPNLEETGSYAFHNTIANNVCLLSNNITTISSGAFYGCPDTSIDIPNGITTIGSYAFYGCKNLETIDIPSSVTTIGSCAFMHCNKLTSITIPEGIKEISFGLFQMCSGLEEIVLPTSLESIGGWAFSSCDKLKNIEIPSTVTTIGEKAFNYWGYTGREFQKILIHKQEGTIIGCPWGASEAIITWLETE